MRKLFTSESVTEGHPDKLCDQIADAILDAILRKKPDARVACEVFATTGVVFIMGEISNGGLEGIDMEAIVRDTIREIGYSDHRFGFDANTVAVITAIHRQSPDIAQGVTWALEVRGGKNRQLGAGDQGMVFGYASDETDELMPMPIYLAHALTMKLAQVRKNGIIPYLGPDGKAQVSVEYEDDKPVRVDTVVISSQHSENATAEQIREDIIRELYEIDNGSFDPCFGSIELPRPEGTPRVFVLAGGGTGIPVFRKLQKENVPFAAGVLYTNDIDYQLARILAMETVTEVPFQEISDEAFARACELMKSCERVIDTGVPVGMCNRRIEELRAEAKRLGKLAE